MISPFRPPRGVTVEVPYRSLVLRADPDFEYKNRHQLFYEFSNGREFREDENQHGAYLPSGLASVALSGVSTAGSAGLIIQMAPHLSGVGGVGAATFVTGIGTEDDVTMHGLNSAGSAGILTATIVASPPFFFGTNISGAENAFPIFPTFAQLQWWKNKNVTHIRLPISWSKTNSVLGVQVGIQPTQLGPLDTTSTVVNGGSYCAALDTLMNNCQTLGIGVLLDLHAFGSGPDGTVGSSALPISSFVDVWDKIMLRYGTHPALYGIDLMNEWFNGFDSSIVFSANQAVINDVRAAPINYTGPIHVEGTNFTGGWNWVSGQGQPFNNANLYQLVDPLNKLVFQFHTYLDNDSSGTNFAYALEAAKAGLAPPGTPTSASIGLTRFTREILPWAQANGVLLCLGECGISNDYVATGGADDYNDWMTAGRNLWAACQGNHVPIFAWGAGLGFGPSYGFNPEPSNVASPNVVDFTTAGLQPPITALYDEFSGFVGTQPIAYRIDLPVTITATGNPEAPTVAKVKYGTSGVASGNFTIRYGGVITSPVTITPHDLLMDGTSAGGTFTPSTIVLGNGENALATFTYTPSQTATIRIGATNNGGWINPPELGYSTFTDSFQATLNPANIYGMLRLYTPYIGPAIRLILPADGVTQQDFYFNNRGDLPRQAIQDWASSRSIRIAIQYDQSGAGNNKTPAAAGFPTTLTLVNADGYPENTIGSGFNMIAQTPSFGQGKQTIMARLKTTLDGLFIDQSVFDDNFRLRSAAYFVAPNTHTSPYPIQVSLGSNTGAWHSLAGTWSNTYSTNNVNGYRDGSLNASASATPFTFAPLNAGTQVDFYHFRFGGANWAGSSYYEAITYDELSSTVIAAQAAADATYWSTPLPDTLSAVAPTITGAGPTNLFTASGTSGPFAAITVTDSNASSPTDSATITLTGAAATLTGSGLSGSGPYTIASATAASLTATLNALILHSTAPLGSTITATLLINSSAGTSATNGSCVVTVSQYGIETSYALPGGTFTPVNYNGVNLSGWETNGFVPTTFMVDYYASKGFGTLRIPIPGSGFYSTAFGALNTTALASLKTLIDYARTKNVRIIIDPHNFGSVFDSTINNYLFIVQANPRTQDLFADMWSRLASRFANYDNVIFGLQNEPHTQTAVDWQGSAAKAITAIRAAGATTQLILIPGVSFTGASTWVSSGNAAAWAGFAGDPNNNFAFEMHQYLDSDSSGTHPIASLNGSTILSAANSWLVTNTFRGFLGEVGFAPDPWAGNPANTQSYLSGATPIVTNGITQGGNIMAYMSANSAQWLGWTYWWGGFISTQPTNGADAYSVEPQHTGNGFSSYVLPIVDQPQIAVLVANLTNTSIRVTDTGDVRVTDTGDTRIISP